MSRALLGRKWCYSGTNSLVLLVLLCLHNCPVLSTVTVFDDRFSGLFSRSYLDVRIGRFILSLLHNSDDSDTRASGKLCDQNDRPNASSSTSNCSFVLGLCLSEMVRTSPNNQQDSHTSQMPTVQSRKISRNAIELSHFPTKCDTGREQIRADLKTINSSHIVLERDEKYRFHVVTLPEAHILLTVKIYLRNSETDESGITLLWQWDGKIEELSPDDRWSTVLMKHHTEQSVASSLRSLPIGENSELQLTSISVDYKYSCKQNYYGPSCNHYCDPRYSSLGHYRCHPQTGAFICKPGWTGTRCNQAVCDQGCIHGFCDRPGRCNCLDGWTGFKCDQCIPIPGCLNGQCHFNPTLGGFQPYTCECNNGWMGMLCNINKNICTSAENPCLNGGECIPTPNLYGQLPLYNCHCPIGFTGTHCEQRVLDCRYHGCGHNGECQNNGNCSCANGYFGSMCQFNQTSCAEFPCLGTRSKCHDTSATSWTENNPSYKCVCETGRYGSNCEFQVNLCSAGNQCLNGGRCVSLVDGYRCICPPKFAGARCEQLRLACQNYSCANGGECLDHGISFTCHCPLGWTGITCHENVNECVEIPRLTGKALCKHGAGCRDLLGSYECLCTTGWTGRHCEIIEQKNTGAETVCSNSSHCSEQPKTPAERPVTQKLSENQTTDPGDKQSVRHFVALFTVMGVTIPLTLITLIAGIILFITNCRSYHKDHTAHWPGYERPTRNLSKVNDYTTKRYLTTTDCQSTLFSASTPSNPRLYSNLFSTKKSSTAWSTTQIEREQLMTPTFRDDRIELEGIGGDQIAPNLEQKSKNDTPPLVRSNNNYLDTEFSHCPYSCVQTAHPLHTTVVSQLPYVEQTVINTLALLSPSRACSPPPPYEEQNDCCFEHVIVNHSKS